MRLTIIFKFVLLFQVFYGFNALAETCENHSEFSQREGEATRIASTEKVHLNEVMLNNIVYADSVDIEFWVEQCDIDDRIEYSLFATITPTVPGSSRGVITYEISVIQNNQQFDRGFNVSNNLFIPGNYWAALQTTYHSSGSVTSFPPDLDLSHPFTLILSCNNSFPSYEDCSTLNPVRHFEINPQSNSQISTISSVNGSWYDPNYNGSGFNLVQTPVGLILYYYGYKANANGEALWLISSIGPKIITKEETFTLDMSSGFVGNGGSLTTKPNTANSGTTSWGSADVTFNSCNRGVIKLTNNNGVTVTHNITLLAGVDELICRD